MPNRAGTLLVLASLVGCSSSAPDAPASPQDAATDSQTETDAPPEDPSLYLDRPLREQVDAMESGKIKSAGLTSGYLARVEAKDKGPSGIHAIIALAPDASKEAAAADASRGKGAKLQGAVILVKDNIDTKALATTAGSLALANNVPAKDAFAVQKVRAANGVILGKTNLSEWANFRGRKSTSGWSSLGGLTTNGRDPAYSPCGSSSGSAAGVAAGLASAALGTETNGSVVCPASVNGVVGFKPTVGLVSRAGVIPISHTQDTIGVLTRTVGDAARLLSVIAGPDPDDPATKGIPSGTSMDFEAGLPTATLAGKRFGALSFAFPTTVRTVFAEERARLEKAGATVIDVKMDMTWVTNELPLLLHEFKVDLNAYLAAHPVTGQPATLKELIAYDDAHASTILQYFGQELFIDAEATTGLDAPEYLAAKSAAVDGAGKNGIAALLSTNKLDALISPTASPAWKSDLTKGDPGIAGDSGPAAVAGYPHLTVPMGNVGGLPVGLSFFAGAWDDAKVLALGYAYEQLAR